MTKQLKRGDQWDTKDRMWVLVYENGKPVIAQGGRLYVFSKRSDASGMRGIGEHIVRLCDLHGEVV